MDLSTTYLGLRLRSPLVPASSPLTRDLGSLRRLEAAGAGAAVLFSLYEEQVRRDLGLGPSRVLGGLAAEAITYVPYSDAYQTTVAGYLELVRQASGSCTIPIIASLNGLSTDAWLDVAPRIQQAGAAAIELNVLFVHTDSSLGSAVTEDYYLELLAALKQRVTIPVAVKLHPYFTSLAHFASRCVEAGADGLVLFNRFYQPDFDIERKCLQAAVPLSNPEEMRLPLMWLANLAGRLPVSLGGGTGVRAATDVVKYLMAGADAVFLASALVLYGPEHLTVLRDELSDWLDSRGYASAAEVKGLLSERQRT